MKKLMWTLLSSAYLTITKFYHYSSKCFKYSDIFEIISFCYTVVYYLLFLILAINLLTQDLAGVNLACFF